MEAVAAEREALGLEADKRASPGRALPRARSRFYHDPESAFGMDGA